VGGGNNQVNWVTVSGNYNRVDHCDLSNRRSQGVSLTLHGGGLEDYNVADHNYFGPGPTAASLCGQVANCLNGWESVRITREELFTESRSAVKYNLFDGADGEGEVVSDKANANYHLFNTFQNLSQGHLTLRHAREALVEGNTFVNCTKGIRAYGEKHVIANNHFQAVAVGIQVPGGQGDLDQEVGQEGKCYYPADKLIVAHNSFTQSGIAVQSEIGNGCGKEKLCRNPDGASDAAAHVILANNFAASGVTPLDQSLPLISPLLVSNLTSLTTPPQGWSFTQAPVSLDAFGVLRAGAGSGIENAGASGATVRGLAGTGSYAVYPNLLVDLDGQSRSLSTPDVGADELGAVPGYARRLTWADVGPRWGTRLAPQ